MSASLEHVGMCEIRVSSSPEVSFVVPGLGSCVALVIYQPGRALAGMAHVLIPERLDGPEPDHPGKFADTAVPRLIQDLLDRGADPSALAAKLVGGAQMFRTGPVPGIGERNVQAVMRALAESRVPVVASDVGGGRGRSVRYEVGPERFWVRSHPGREEVLQ